MKYIVNSREMKIYDSNTTEKFFVPPIVLMERAALAFVGELDRRGIDASRALIVCGDGNNGGDGYAIARLLIQRGCEVDVVAAAAYVRNVDGAGKDSNGSSGSKNRGSATELNLLQQKIWRAYGREIFAEIPQGMGYKVIIDAVFGVGLSRGVEGAYAALLTQMNELCGRKIAVDIASGISSDNGSVPGAAFRADLTVTFAFAKLGNLLWPGNEYAGEVATVDIGIDEGSFLERKPAVASLEECDLALLPRRSSHSNKGTYGKALLIAGSQGMAGAAILCAKAACAGGCGLVRIFTPEENRIVLQTAVPEAIVTAYTTKSPELAALTEAVNWADVIVCGPGIGTSDTAIQTVKSVLKHASVPVLLDADALNIIAGDVDLLMRPHTALILTPHPGEMSRLAGVPVSYIQAHLIEVAQEFSRQYHVVCVLKDEHTVTAVPCGQTFLNLSGNAGMATAGSGDVLSGLIGALIAQGMSPEEAAPMGVYLHGLAGDFVRGETGMRGMLASDITDGIKAFFASFEQDSE